MASLAVMVVAALIWLPATAGAAPQSYGFNDLSWFNTGIPHAIEKAEVADTGAKYWRMPLSWQYFQPAENTFNPGFLPDYMDAYNQMLANGQKPVFVVMGTPYWALAPESRGLYRWPLYCGNNNNATQCFAPPNVRNANIRSKWQVFMQIMAYFMPQATFEIWNEPNAYWSWMGPQDPELYAQMLSSAADAVHAYTPNTKVISGGLNAYRGPDNPSLTDATSFLRQVEEDAGASSFDAIGVHAYPCNSEKTVLGWQKQVAKTVTDLRAARDAAGDHTRPLWVTETGATTGPPSSANCNQSFTEDEQGPALNAVLTWTAQENDRKGDIPVVLVHSLFNYSARADIDTPNAAAENEFGLIAWAVDSDGSVTLKRKPGLGDVTCRFAGTC